ncbi:hypothetical protein FBUS_02263 [Fasciolopsis buskii]|uniref:Cadherin domain-containing protein n=1 Tax=Fasciolopsis buskii TaxID=27845 RepID=A0A8E0S391_9TREM|nr:hypothetical protein FBUS_02263 [Fasciolopsis buski]
MDPICYWCILFYTSFVSFFSGVLTISTMEQSTEVIELHTTVQEERPVGQVIMRLAEEIGQYDQKPQHLFHTSRESLRFHLLPTHDASLFHINADGSLVIAKRLDYEELCDSARMARYSTPQIGHPTVHDPLTRSIQSACRLTVRVLILQATIPIGTRKTQTGNENVVNSAGTQRKLRTVIITINLIDANDNRPTCTLSRHHMLDAPVYSGSEWIEVPENTPIGTVVATWKLTDRDTASNGITDARLLGTKNGKTTLLTTGELPFRLQFDQTIGPWTTVKLKLILSKSVEYINQQTNSRDNPDDFDVYNLKIFILDSKDISDGGAWNSPVVTTTTAANCQLQVRISDINDHNPVWISPINFVNGQPLEMELTESKSYIQRDLVRLKATDDDRGPNARVSYQWARQNGFNFSQDTADISTESYQELIYRLFYLDANTGSLQLRGSNLDFESISRFHPRKSDSGLAPGRLPITLYVVAVDQPVNRSEQRMSPVGTIIIWLLDANDHSPHIQIIGLHSSVESPVFPFPVTNSATYPQILYVTENLSPNEPVAFVTVTDEDSEAHGGIACTLHQSTIDRNQPEPVSFQLVKVEQQTVSDESSQSYLMPDMIRKPDASRSVNYKLITTQSLDRESTPTYQLNLSCTDSLISTALDPVTRLTSSRLIEIVVVDRNDNPPRIVGVVDRATGKLNSSTTTNGAFVCTIREHATVGTKICQLRAEDPDQTGKSLAVNSASESFHWWLEDSVRTLIDIERETGWLIVNGHGKIEPLEQSLTSDLTGRIDYARSSSNLDRETLSELSFTAYVQDIPHTNEDSRLTASATILLRITDINDHVPKISKYNYFQISEAAAPGTVIGNLEALDGDEPNHPNSALTYTIYSHGDRVDKFVPGSQPRETPVLPRRPGDPSAGEIQDIKVSHTRMLNF